jgi:surface polysaccharide O-acyltransferase-like enzyme
VDFLRVVNSAFVFLHISLYSTYSTAVYTQKGAFFSKALMNTSEHTSVWVSSSITCLPIFFSRSGGLIVVNPVHKMNIGLFCMGERHICDEFSLLT